jgi:hypothetical protein
MPRSSIGIGTAEKEETLSTMSATSSYFLVTEQSSSKGFMTPVEVSLWISVTASKSPVASFWSSVSGSICLPHSTLSPSASLPQRRVTSSHLSEKAPHMQLRTRREARLRMAASITPQADEVERKTGCFVPKSVCRRGWTER